MLSSSLICSLLAAVQVVVALNSHAATVRITGKAATPTSLPSTGKPPPARDAIAALRLSSFSVQQSTSTLNVVASVQNIAYTKLVSVLFCDAAPSSSACSPVTGGSGSGKFACQYSNKFNATFEIWKCSSSSFPNGLASFSLQYIVSGTTYTDNGPTGNGYLASLSAPVITITTTTSTTTTSTTTTATTVFSTFTTTTPTSPSVTTSQAAAPSFLPGCQNYNGLDSCSGQSTSYDPSVEQRRWQTPPRDDPRWTPTYGDYSQLQAYTDVVYNSARTAATLTVKPFTNDPSAVVQCSFGGAAMTTVLTFQVTNSFLGNLSINCGIVNTQYTLTLDDFYFFWDMPSINRPETQNGQKGAIVELFGWPYNDIAQECEFLGKAGYMGLRVYAPNEHVMSNEWMEPDGNFNPWYFVYQPVSYRLESRQGTLLELRAMIKSCRNFGVRVFADAVVNHMSGNGNAVNPKRDGNQGYCHYWDHHNSSNGSPYYTHGYSYMFDPVTQKRPALEFPAVPWGPSDFHCERSLDSWTSGFVMQYGWLDGLADLNTGKDNVRERIATYYATLLSVGFSGFRVDSGKHISPDDHAAIFGKLSKKMGGSLPAEFVTYLEVLLGGEKDLLCCQYSNYNYYQYLTDALISVGISQADVMKIKIWSSDYPKEMPACGSWIIPAERFVIQNDDHDQQSPGSSSRDMQSYGSVLIVEKDIPSHRGFEVELFNRRDANWLIRAVLSGWFFKVGSNAQGWPDGKSSCALYNGNQTLNCGDVPYHKAFVADACGYSMVVNGNWEVGAYTRTHRDTSIINAMRGWMGLAPTNQAALGIPSSCP